MSAEWDDQQVEGINLYGSVFTQDSHTNFSLPFQGRKLDQISVDLLMSKKIQTCQSGKGICPSLPSSNTCKMPQTATRQALQTQLRQLPTCSQCTMCRCSDAPSKCVEVRLQSLTLSTIIKCANMSLLQPQIMRMIRSIQELGL